MDQSILVVDDEAEISEELRAFLSEEGYSAHSVRSGFEALEFVKRHPPRLILLDVRLPDIKGVEVLKEIKGTSVRTEVIMITAYGSIELAVTCMKLGALDFLEKPVQMGPLMAKVRNVFQEGSPEKAVFHPKDTLSVLDQFNHILGHSRKMKNILERVAMAAKSNVNVLLMGESGTGKEIVARTIHFNGIRGGGPFVAVNCGAIPDTLLESELYGYERGAFTGAVSRKIGKFEQAQDGTIFLDEIGDLGHSLQIKLLRVLQEREIERIGGNQTIGINVRFISATNRELDKWVKEGKFREDLYFRINVFPIVLPPLRQRREDVPDLLRYFIQLHAGEKRRIEVTRGGLDRLMEYDWPGNIRELENFVERTVLLKGDDQVITEEDVQFLGHTASEFSNRAVETLDEAEKMMIENTLEKVRGNVSQAAKILRISRDTLYRKIRKYSIKLKKNVMAS